MGSLPCYWYVGMRSNPSLSQVLKPDNINHHKIFLLASLFYGFKYTIKCIKMITKSSPWCSIVVVLWFGVGFGSKLWSKPARKARRNALKITPNSSKRLESVHFHGCPPLSTAVRRGGGALGGCRGSERGGTRWAVGRVRVRVVEEREREW